MSTRFLGLLIVVAGCGPGESGPSPASIERVDVQELTGLRIYFGHQSVGRDVLTGLAEVAPAVTIVTTDALPQEGGALIEESIGSNQHPDTKDRAFLTSMAAVGPVDLALYKYCFVDVEPATDPAALFENYARTLAASPTRTAAVTVPLTTVEPRWKRWLKQLAGRPTQADLNAKRMQFNELVRQQYGDAGIIDLARLESTRADGSRCLIEVDGASVECLVPEFTDDGAHLNERGRRHVAAGFVEALARVTATD